MAIRRRFLLSCLGALVAPAVTVAALSTVAGKEQPSNADYVQMPTVSATATLQANSATLQSTATPETERPARFAGTLNGVTFVEEENTVTPEDECQAGSFRSLSPQASQWAISNSDLNFAPRYLPAGFQLGLENAALCDNNLIIAGRVYVNEDNLPLSITRAAGQPVFNAVAPRERLEARSFGGRPGVLVHPSGPMDFGQVFMFDGVTSWIVSTNLGVDELIRIAGGVAAVPPPANIGK